MSRPLTGLWPPVATPFATDGSPDFKRQVAHSRQLLAEGAQGLALLGTTSEANSLTLAERRRTIEAHVEAGIAAERLLPGTGACAIGDAAELSRLAADLGCAGVLMLPPFYYKGVSADGIFAFYAKVIEKLGARPPRILLYHIPQMSGVGFSLELIRRLRDAFPGVVAGIKDSSGDWENTKSILEAFPGFATFPGTELDAARAMAHGAVGVISATANVNAAGIAHLLAHLDAADAAARQAEANAVRVAISRRGNIEASKAVLAVRYRDEGWLAVRPPLVTLASEARAELLTDPAIVRLLARELA